MAYNHNGKGGSAEGQRPSGGGGRGGNRFNGSKKRSGQERQHRGEGSADTRDRNGNGNATRGGRNKRVRHNGAELPSKPSQQSRRKRSRYAPSYDEGSEPYQQQQQQQQQQRPSRYEGTQAHSSQQQQQHHEEQYRHSARPAPKGKFMANLPRGPRAGHPLPTAPAASSNAPPSRYDSTSNGSRQGSPGLSVTPVRSRSRGESPRPPIQKKEHISSSFITQTRTTSIYDRILQVGEGTYGKVYKARNNNTQHVVALKKLRLQNEREGFPITSIREIKLLQTFDHINVSTVREIMVEQNHNVYMIFEYADNDLGGLLLNSEIHISDAQKKHIFRQLLQGCEYLHSNGILHRDIKGSNILIDNSGVLRITDFGLARRMTNHSVTGSDTALTPTPSYTNRVITLWYRPPELLLGATNYSAEVDMWGCGCLLMELFNSTAIFQGTNELEQLVTIFSVMGTPTTETWPDIFDMPWFFMVIPFMKQRFEETFDLKYQTILPSYECFKLVKGLLKYDQKTRLTAKEALESPYFTENPRPEPLVLKSSDETLGGCHEYEIKLAKKKKKAERAR
ncbi:cyclin-dependent serine/threonine protein kinase [Maudiozyma humilis]|uniref:[RNA-polymerase]-subunit kinase n=1 Tax=Maudiozyma humilis TaxID=51915 RepID=A0AAV5RSF4_MAUHU|nr:cyclin-dependent serine/threonine protein kinase [Kazachstania humilis]